MRKVWNAQHGFGEVLGAFTYGRVHYLRIRWDASPWYVDEVPSSDVAICG